jgi:hypothetical protein
MTWNKLAIAQLQRGQGIRLHVAGWSMAPLLQPGDSIRVAPIRPVQVRRGDIVVVWCDGYFLTHRVIRASAQELLLKGDFALMPDLPVSSQALVGRVLASERGAHRIDLRRRSWRVANRALGWTGWLCIVCNRPGRLPLVARALHLAMLVLVIVVICGGRFGWSNLQTIE